ncbi:MAG TPA: glycosyltransferase 87 family protein [Nitrososphaerales archaeon]|nr:glycosyltransferase 87 family protein [Nitrososphaerales archaeon]
MRSEFDSSNAGWIPAKLRDLLNDPQYTSIMLAAGVSFLVSILIHFPLNNSPQFYSDFLGSFWGRSTPSGLREVVVGIPYVTYVFEYPPICGLILWLGGWASEGNIYIFSIVEFGVLLVVALFMAHYVYQFTGYLGLNRNRQLLYSIFAPSLLLYGAYNFDIVQTLFVVVSLYFFMARKEMKLSAGFLGLAIATKLSPALLVPLFWQELRTRNERISFTVVMGAVVGALNIPFMIVNFNTWLAGYTFLKNWGLEDSFLVWIFNNQNSWGLAKDISYVLVGVSALCVYIFFRSKPLLVRSMMILGAFILFSYIATPQMNLDLLPLFALVPMIPLSLFYLYELADIGIILFWFAFQPNNVTPSVPQAFALLRQIYLATILGILGFSKKLTKF